MGVGQLLCFLCVTEEFQFDFYYIIIILLFVQLRIQHSLPAETPEEEELSPLLLTDLLRSSLFGTC